MARWTTKKLEKLEPKGKPFSLTEGESLFLKVSAAGKKTFYCYYRSPVDGRRRWYPIGVFPYRSLSSARDERNRILTEVALKKDPLLEEAKRELERKRAPTMVELATEYLERHAKPNKRSWREDQRWLEKDVLPVLGKMKAREVRRADVIELLDRIQSDPKRGDTAPKHVLAVTRKLFSWALSRDLVEFNVCRGVDVYKPDPRKRTVKDEELRILWHGLEKTGIREDLARILRVLMLTGQRSGEVAGMRWEEIEGRWWTIPGARSKNKRPHRVYLTDSVVSLLGNPGEGPVFPSPVVEPDKPVSYYHVSRAANKAVKALGIEDLRAHDLRGAVASGMSRLGILKTVRDRVQNWVDASVSAQHYDAYDFDAEKKDALVRWEKELKKIVSGLRVADPGIRSEG